MSKKEAEINYWDANFKCRRFVLDVAVNVGIYIPLGMSAFLAFRRFQTTALELLSPIAIGTLRLASVEMLQLFTPHPRCSSIDLVNNSLIGYWRAELSTFAHAPLISPMRTFMCWSGPSSSHVRRGIVTDAAGNRRRR
jgi:hypothetical protein